MTPILTKEDELRQANFFQTVCEKHEWVKVVMTSNSSENSDINRQEWEQCRFCGIMRPLPTPPQSK
jgi:hypothetical protein